MAAATALVSVTNLGTPGNLSIAGGFLIGMIVRIYGSVPKDGKRFRVDFLCGENRKGENAFHFNQRSEDGVDIVILNSFLRNEWGKQKMCHSPFHKGKDFQLEFVITKNSFKMIVDKHYLCDFSHRVPLEQVKSLRVAGDVVVKQIDIFKDSNTSSFTLPGSK